MSKAENIEISAATWCERVDAEFERLGGPSMPLSFRREGIARVEAIERAKIFATANMMDEIHLMLRMFTNA